MIYLIIHAMNFYQKNSAKHCENLVKLCDQNLKTVSNKKSSQWFVVHSALIIVQA